MSNGMTDSLEQELTSKMRHVIDEATTRAAQIASRAKGVVTSRASSMSTLMREHPMATIAVGLAVGYLLSRRLRRH
jgi:ElaB/YqjD/DUF883 family membrane-anchored ribosome-binding protein